MRKLFLKIVSLMLFAVSITAASNAQAQVRATRVSDRQIQTVLTRIEIRTDDFRRQVDRGLDRSTANGTSSEDAINNYVRDFETATDNLRRNFDSRRAVAADVQEVLNRASFINGFMRDYRLNSAAQRTWNVLRTDLNTLARYYNVSWNWNTTYNPGNQFGTMLTGTYRLNTSQSDNVANIVNSSISADTTTNRDDRVRRNLERRLASPETLVIDKVNNQVTIGSNLSPQVTLDADGVRRTETNPNGRSVSVRATTLSNGLEIAYEGDRTNDFFLTFMPMNNGQLRVTRRLYLENRNQTVTVNSVYDKISQTADFSRVNTTTNVGQNYPSSTGGTVSGDFVVPNGTQYR